MPLQPHAEPFSAPGDQARAGGRSVGVLLCHGFTGSPASMAPWASALVAEGFAVEVPRLPGHGTTWQEMNRTGWQDWYAEVSLAFDRLRSANDDVVVAGLSMGGGLALQLAADHADDVAGVVLVNPAVSSTDRQLLAVPALKYVLGSVSGIGSDIKMPGGDEYGYDRTPLRALHSMLRGWKRLRNELGKVTAPILMFRSIEDHVVDPSSGRVIASTVSSRDVTERLLENSFHVATLDNDAPMIFAESADFVRRLTTA